MIKFQKIFSIVIAEIVVTCSAIACTDKVKTTKPNSSSNSVYCSSLAIESSYSSEMSEMVSSSSLDKGNISSQKTVNETSSSFTSRKTNSMETGIKNSSSSQGIPAKKPDYGSNNTIIHIAMINRTVTGNNITILFRSANVTDNPIGFSGKIINNSGSTFVFTKKAIVFVAGNKTLPMSYRSYIAPISIPSDNISHDYTIFVDAENPSNIPCITATINFTDNINQSINLDLKNKQQ